MRSPSQGVTFSYPKLHFFTVSAYLEPNASRKEQAEKKKSHPETIGEFEAACYRSRLRQSCIILLAPTRGTPCLAWTISLPINHLVAILVFRSAVRIPPHLGSSNTSLI